MAGAENTEILYRFDQPMSHDPATDHDYDRKDPAYRILLPFRHFMRLEASGGILLLAVTILALIWANSPWHESYFHLWEIHHSISFGSFHLSKPLHVWINDGLMAMFFFVVGLELKREMMVGALSSPRKALLPVIAAFGGMIVPADAVPSSF